MVCQMISIILYICRRLIHWMCHLQDLKTSAFSSKVSVSNPTDVCLANSTLDKVVDYKYLKFVWVKYWYELLRN